MSSASAEEEVSLILIVEGIKEHRGQIIAAVFPCEKTYESNDNPKWHVQIKVEEAGSVSHEFKKVTPGRYAIKLFHDVNGNEELDTNWLGIPREPYGFSNNPRIRFGPPSFDTAAFEVTAGDSVEKTIQLN